MFDVLKSMIKEEWRMHSSLFGHSGFALFPVFIFSFTFFCKPGLACIQGDRYRCQIALGIHYLFLLVGAMLVLSDSWVANS
ncbi:hypothetical protein [Methanosarcina horonobensis]|uniref:hypothetical protein n=1 Tax=Methanosarcina horonobensis TaxID=418008 RepID=UPI000A44A847|nr:hypothetical protein [Methanosarcina horonobensis]